MAEVWDQLDLGPNAHAFFKRVYSSGLGKYTRRLAALGFPGGRRALDAGCGLGQWSFALAAMSSEVYGVDISQERIDACNKISQLLRVKNTRFLSSTLEHLPFENAYFDRLICYSALYLTNYEESIKEFARVIAPGGLLYLSTNGVGRYLYEIVKRPNPASDFDPRKFGALTLWNTLVGRRTGLSAEVGGVVTGQSKTLRLLRNSDFEILGCGEEGSIPVKTESFLPGYYWGFVSTFDILARKL